MLTLTPPAGLPTPPETAGHNEVRLLPTYYCSFDWVAGQYVGKMTTATGTATTTEHVEVNRPPWAATGGLALLAVGVILGAVSVTLALRELKRGKRRTP